MLGIIFAILFATFVVAYVTTNLIWWASLSTTYIDYPFNWRALVLPYNYIIWSDDRESESDDY